MAHALGSIFALLLATGLLLSGNGLFGTLSAVRANIEAFPLPIIGMLMSAYYAGFILGCWYNPYLVKRVGHIRAFTALAAIASVAALFHAIIVDPIAWLVLRSVIGFCFAGLAMVTESWINENATNDNRGRLFSLYRVVDLGSMTMGQVLLVAADPQGFQLFALVSMLICLALVPIALTTATAPRPIVSAKLNLSKVMRVSPFAALGVLAAGLANGAFWGLGPVFVQNSGYETGMVAAFMSSVIIGGVLAQFPVGALSDLFDRRHVLVGVAVVGAFASLGVAVSVPLGVSAFLFAGFFFGAMSLSFYSLAVAHANDRAEQTDFVEVSGTLLLLFGMGAMIGPFLGALTMDVFGDVALFFYAAVIQATLSLYGLYRIAVTDRVPLGEQDDYVAAPRTTPQIIELDPRSDVDFAADVNPANGSANRSVSSVHDLA